MKLFYERCHNYQECDFSVYLDDVIRLIVIRNTNTVLSIINMIYEDIDTVKESYEKKESVEYCALELEADNYGICG